MLQEVKNVVKKALHKKLDPVSAAENSGYKDIYL